MPTRAKINARNASDHSPTDPSRPSHRSRCCPPAPLPRRGPGRRCPIATRPLRRRRPAAALAAPACRPRAAAAGAGPAGRRLGALPQRRVRARRRRSACGMAARAWRWPTRPPPSMPTTWSRAKHPAGDVQPGRRAGRRAGRGRARQLPGPLLAGLRAGPLQPGHQRGARAGAGPGRQGQGRARARDRTAAATMPTRTSRWPLSTPR